ncbi:MULTISPECIES: serine/threonine-protein kinase [unclassified Solwaraspora]|uniref:serine/threonine-protein kinase n=1 Tax=unclassified Solwaraspora TaxID=2627926 RepID=UPI00259B99BB|nr:serine/threonine-protein kinase [Solwaraspora sp. WMMA2056]WJK41376.1 serine/threonine-protein kinase [Solwaraspora sp. WMMA2056]
MRTLGGRYRLDIRIGVGGMSEVWRAHDEVLDRPVAVKLIAPHLVDHVRLERVRWEARAAARLAHPNVASVHDFGVTVTADGRPEPYIVMELVQGRTLAEHLAAGPLDWRIAVRICAEVSAALAAAHAHDIVHRDIKPANVVLTAAGAKVLDFGIAAAVGGADVDPDGSLPGTPAFVAPERWDGGVATAASDSYATGVLLYLCLAGRLPWSMEPGRRRPPRHVAPEPLPSIDGLPVEVTQVCRLSLSRDPAARPSSVAAALLLAESVDAQVYVPIADLAVPRPRSVPARQRGAWPAVPRWDERAAQAPTDLADGDARAV